VGGEKSQKCGVSQKGSYRFAHVIVLLCLVMAQGGIPAIAERLCPAALSTTLPSIQPLATTLLADTILLRIHPPPSSLYKHGIGATGFLLDS